MIPEETNTAEETGEVKEPEMANETASTESEEPTEQTPAANEKMIGFINRFNPGADTSTPEAIIAAATTVMESFVPVYDKLYDVVSTDNQAASYVNDLLETGDPLAALANNYSEEEVLAAVEEMKSDKYADKVSSFNERKAAAKTRQAELEANKAKSQMSAQEFMDKYQPEEDDLEKFIAFYDGIIKDAVDNNMSLDHWERLWKAYKYDGTVAELENKVGEAEEMGKIAGRNEKIIQGKKDRESLAELLPETSGGGALPKTEKPKSFAGSFMNGVI